MADEGVLDPWVVDWLAAHPLESTPIDEFPPELLPLARGGAMAPPTRPMARVTDECVDDVPIRIYEVEGTPTGLVVYFHGGGWMIGSIGLMDNVARELADSTGAVVISVGYRLAPEHPYPAGLDDCEDVTRWALANVHRYGLAPERVVVAGESAGGNLAAAVSCRLRNVQGVPLAGQVLMYPLVDNGTATYASRDAFSGVVVSRAQVTMFWETYGGGREIDTDPFAAPLHADSLTGLPRAFVVLGGCDVYRDEGRAYAARLRADGVEVEEICYPGQPHGFVNFGLPVAGLAFERIGAWVQSVFARSVA